MDGLCLHSSQRIYSPRPTQIFDSRGNPTVEVDLYTSKGEYNIAMRIVCD